MEPANKEAFQCMQCQHKFDIKIELQEHIADKHKDITEELLKESFVDVNGETELDEKIENI